MQIRKIVPGIAALAILLMAVPTPAPAQVSFGIGVSVDFGPPEIPVYVQPPCPEQNYIWAPGYWSYGDYGYFWVPGTWVAAPEPGYLWTPGYWGYNSGSYGWNQGYWGTQVGFYGGINYGAGYYGSGYAGGNWSGNNFRYNTAVSVVDTTVIRNVYRSTVVNRGGGRAAYNGGPGGIQVRPTAGQLAVAHARHIAMVPAQRQNEQIASQNRAYLAKVNNGVPKVAAVARPLSADNRPADFQPLSATDKKTFAAAAKSAAHPKAAAAPKAAAPKTEEHMKPAAAPKAAVAPAKPVVHQPAAPVVHHAAAPAPRQMPVHQAAPPRQAPQRQAPMHQAPPPRQAPQRQAAPQHQSAPQHQPEESHRPPR